MANFAVPKARGKSNENAECPLCKTTVSRLGELKCRKCNVRFNWLEFGKEKQSKYHNQKTVVDGITFDSKKEADRYCELKLLKQAGEIKDFELQPVFILVEAQEFNGQIIKPLTYRADFKIIYPNGSVIVEDVKGYRTQVYKNKVKMLLAKYPDIDFKEV